MRAQAGTQLHRKELCEVPPALLEGGAVGREPAGGGLDGFLLGRTHAGRWNGWVHVLLQACVMPPGCDFVVSI
eukprot:10028931-Heterocapsa_arctica.AAC.1